MEATTADTRPSLNLKTGLVRAQPVGGEFQPQLETGYPGGGAHLIFVFRKQFDADACKLKPCIINLKITP